MGLMDILGNLKRRNNDGFDNKGHAPSTGSKSLTKTIISGVVGTVAASALYSSFFTVGETERGLLYTFGKLSTVSPADIKKQGLNFKIPFIQTVRKMPVGIQERVLDKVNIYSKDSQDFDAKIQYVFEIPESSLVKIAQKLASNEQIDSLVQNNVLQALKGSMGKEEATDIPSKRNEVVNEARKDADSQVQAAIGINITGLTMPNFEFNSAFKTAVASASQMKAQAEKARQEVEKTKAEAQSAMEEASGKAEAAKREADGKLYAVQKAAEGQKKLIEAIGRENLSAYWFKETWNGQLPQMVGGQGVAVTTMSAVAASAGQKTPAPSQ